MHTPVNEPSRKSTLRQGVKRTTEKLQQFIRPNALILMSFLPIEREIDNGKENQTRRTKTYWRYFWIMAVWNFQTLKIVETII